MSKDSSIICLCNQKAILFDGENVESVDFKETKTYFTAAIIPLKYLNTFSYKIANGTGDDEIAMQTEIKMYSEGGLNVDKEYVIDFIKYETGDDYLIEAFALCKDNFDEYFKEHTKEVAAIDMLFPRFLAYQALYDEKAPKESNDLILYISESESFAALFQYGKYIGHRVMSSLNDISKRVGIEVVKLKEYLQTKGLVQSNYALDEIHILDSVQGILFKDMEKIMYSMNQKRSLFGFDSLHRVYIDFYEHNILGLEQFFVPYGYDALEIKKINFEDDDKYGNIAIYVNYIYKYYATKEENPDYYQHLNFSFLERKKPLINYLLVKYGILFTITILLCAAIYVYIELQFTAQGEKIAHKQAILQKEKKKALKFEKKLRSLKKQNVALQKQVEKIEDDVFVYETTLRTVPLIRETKYKRQQFMNDVVSTLAKYKLNTLSMMQYDDKNMDIVLISDSRDRANITSFIDDLLKKNYHSVSTKQIHLDKNVYKSLVRIKL